MSNLESGTFPHAASKFPSEKTTDCNNDLVLQGINNLQKDLGEVKGDIKSIKTDVSDTKGDIKVINNRLEVLDKTVGKNSDGINALSNKAYLIYAYFNSFFHKPFRIANGQLAELAPKILTPLKIKGMTVLENSAPPAKPTLETLPHKLM